MSQADLKAEQNLPVEPLLPIEKKLIGWSLGIGVVSLIVLVVINHFVPIKVCRRSVPIAIENGRC